MYVHFNYFFVFNIIYLQSSYVNITYFPAKVLQVVHLQVCIMHYSEYICIASLYINLMKYITFIHYNQKNVNKLMNEHEVLYNLIKHFSKMTKCGKTQYSTTLHPGTNDQFFLPIFQIYFTYKKRIQKIIWALRRIFKMSRESKCLRFNAEFKFELCESTHGRTNSHGSSLHILYEKKLLRLYLSVEASRSIYYL